jgi:hypothetical protein
VRYLVHKILKLCFFHYLPLLTYIRWPVLFYFIISFIVSSDLPFYERRRHVVVMHTSFLFPPLQCATVLHINWFPHLSRQFLVSLFLYECCIISHSSKNRLEKLQENSSSAVTDICILCVTAAFTGSFQRNETTQNLLLYFSADWTIFILSLILSTYFLTVSFRSLVFIRISSLVYRELNGRSYK